MTSASAAFFEDLRRTGHVPLLQRVKGTMRFDLDDDGGIEHWYVAVDKGDVKVSRKKTSADAVVNTDLKLLDDMVQGRVNATAAMLRGLVSVEGNLGLLMLFQRLFPGPPRSAAVTAERGEARS
jgi:putative sterol carrier protein